MSETQNNSEINIFALVKGKERYIFVSDNAHLRETLRTLGRFASDPELSLTWRDAAALSQQIRMAFFENLQYRDPHIPQD